jgi:hypothetical protein
MTVLGRRLISGTALGLMAFALLGPGVASAHATGSVSPHTVERGDDAEFTIDCDTSSKHASLTGTSLGLPSNIEMDRITSTFFELDITIPNRASFGRHEVSMQCDDGSFAEVTLVVSPHGGPDTGDGAMSIGASTPAIAAGASLVLIAGAGAIVLMRRRTVR